MNKDGKVDSKEIGLEIGLIFAKQCLQTEYLHYGYWSDGLKVESANVFEAQENYANLLLSHIPAGTKTILDVGAGSGKFAEKLVAHGYEVECVSPSPYLTQYAKSILGSKVKIHELVYEKLNIDRTFDLVLFSESFQYIAVEDALQQSLRYLHPKGHILICDFFRRDGVEGFCPISGGHSIGEFYQQVKQYPLETVVDLDITKETAPSLDVMHGILNDFLLPIAHVFGRYMVNNHPLISKAFDWKFNKKIEKVKRKYHATDGEHFSKFKTYHLLVYQRIS